MQIANQGRRLVIFALVNNDDFEIDVFLDLQTLNDEPNAGVFFEYRVTCWYDDRYIHR